MHELDHLIFTVTLQGSYLSKQFKCFNIDLHRSEFRDLNCHADMQSK